MTSFLNKVYPGTNTHHANATHTSITDTAKEDKTTHEAPATPIEDLVALDVGEGDAQGSKHTMEQKCSDVNLSSL